MREQGIICEMDFFRRFMEYYKLSERSFETRRQDKNWWSLYESMQNSRLSFDCDYAVLYQFIQDDVMENYPSNLNNCPSFRLIKALQDKGMLDLKNKKIMPESLSFCNLSDEDLMSIFLVDNDSKLDVGEALGVYVMTSDTYLLSDDYNGVAKAVHENDVFDWESAMFNMPNQNSALIMDRYIACNPYDVRNNIFPIIDNLLPDYLSVPFHLSIMTYEHDGFDHYKLSQNLFAPEKFEPEDLDELSYGEKLHYILEKYIKSKKPNLKLQLTVYICGSRDFHDRIILSNSAFVNCSGGFNLLKWNNDTKKMVSSIGTTIDLAVRGICDKSITEKIALYYDMAKGIASNKVPIGGRINRLFTYENN